MQCTIRTMTFPYITLLENVHLLRSGICLECVQTHIDRVKKNRKWTCLAYVLPYKKQIVFTHVVYLHWMCVFVCVCLFCSSFTFIPFLYYYYSIVKIYVRSKGLTFLFVFRKYPLILIYMNVLTRICAVCIWPLNKKQRLKWLRGEW